MTYVGKKVLPLGSKPAPRTCLMCKAVFMSMGPGNRRCGTCEGRFVSNGNPGGRTCKLGVSQRLRKGIR